MTWGFFYLLIFLGGFTVALVTGLIRRILHPSELCDGVVAPSHEHWRGLHTPITDFLAAFTTVFGLATFIIHGLSSLSPAREIGFGAAAGVLGAIVLRVWIRQVCEPSSQVGQALDTATVVREIPANGFGQVEVSVAGTLVKLAAKSRGGAPISEGVVVQILDRRESLVEVAPAGP